MATDFMNLTLPTVSTTLGPTWATQLNTALEVADAHDHTSGKGKPVPTAGIDINAALDFNEYKATGLLAAQFEDQEATLTGASYASSTYSVDGDLYYTNGAGNAVQITDGGALLAVAGAVETLTRTTIAGNLTIAAGDAFVYIEVDTSASRTITLPAASAVAAGRIYVIKDATGTSLSFPMTLEGNGTDTVDGELNQTLDSNFGCWWVIRGSSTTWYLI